MISLQELFGEIQWTPPQRAAGTLCGVRGGLAYARLPLVSIGDLCYIERGSAAPLAAQVISFNEDLCCLAPFDGVTGISPGAQVITTGQLPTAHFVGDPRGTVVDAFGIPMIEIPLSQQDPILECPLECAPPLAMSRVPISKQLITGIRSIDALHSIGYGQRIGLFAGAGVGKSTLLGMIARNAEIDVAVIALVGERGREVREFVELCLGPEGRSKSVVVVATSDESPLRRMLAPKTATAIAEWYRARGLKVLLLVDSITRTARAIREVELAAGALPVRQGYTSGVYSELPKLLERAGNCEHGSITGIYTVLTSGNEEYDPLADEIKSILDGHIVLDQSIAQQGIRPAIDSVLSVSRVAERLIPLEYSPARNRIVEILARLRRDRDIVLMGGTPDAELKAALSLEPQLAAFLSQAPNERIILSESLAQAQALAARHAELRSQYAQKG